MEKNRTHTAFELVGHNQKTDAGGFSEKIRKSERTVRCLRKDACSPKRPLLQRRQIAFFAKSFLLLLRLYNVWTAVTAACSDPEAFQIPCIASDTHFWCSLLIQKVLNVKIGSCPEIQTQRSRLVMDFGVMTIGSRKQTLIMIK